MPPHNSSRCMRQILWQMPCPQLCPPRTQFPWADSPGRRTPLPAALLRLVRRPWPPWSKKTGPVTALSVPDRSVRHTSRLGGFPLQPDRAGREMPFSDRPSHTGTGPLLRFPPVSFSFQTVPSHNPPSAPNRCSSICFHCKGIKCKVQARNEKTSFLRPKRFLLPIATANYSPAFQIPLKSRNKRYILVS